MDIQKTGSHGSVAASVTYELVWSGLLHLVNIINWLFVRNRGKQQNIKLF